MASNADEESNKQLNPVPTTKSHGTLPVENQGTTSADDHGMMADDLELSDDDSYCREGYNEDDYSDEEYLEDGIHGGHISQERSGMALRVRNIGIRPAWWAEKTSKQNEDVALSSPPLNETEEDSNPVKSPRNIPFDIAYCILSHIADLETLRNAILINQAFASCFTTFRVGVVRAVLLSMFGAECLDHALTLATMLQHNGPVKDAKGKISVMPPDPSILHPTPIMREVTKIYYTTNTWVELWETQTMWRYNQGGKTDTRVPLSYQSRLRLVRAIILFWLYSHCARNTLQYSGPAHSSCSSITLKGTAIFDTFSLFELLETNAVFEFYYGLVQTACQDCEMEGDDHYYDWQYYCVSCGPNWMLRLLDSYNDAFWSAHGEDEMFFSSLFEEELETRGIPDASVDFTDNSADNLAKILLGMSIDGNARPADGRRTCEITKCQ